MRAESSNQNFFFLNEKHRSPAKLGLSVFGILMLSGCFNGQMNWQALSPDYFQGPNGSNQPGGFSLFLQAGFFQAIAGGSITPSPSVALIDSNGNKVAQQDFAATISLFQNAACSSNSSASVVLGSQSSSNGTAVFSNLFPGTVAGNYFIQAQGVGYNSSQCLPVTVVAGPPDHLVSGSSNSYSATVGSSVVLSAQLVDQYNNSTHAPSGAPVSVTFSQYSQASPSATSTAIATDSSGRATFSVTPDFSSGNPLIIARAVASGLSNPIAALPIFAIPGAISGIRVDNTNFPSVVLSGDTEWVELKAVDGSGFLVPDAQISGTLSSLNTLTNWSISPSDQGAKWVSVTPSYPNPSATALATLSVSSSAGTGVVSASSSYSVSSSRSFTCSNSPAAIWSGVNSSDWLTATNWNFLPSSLTDVLFTSANVRGSLLQSATSGGVFQENIPCLQMSSGQLTVDNKISETHLNLKGASSQAGLAFINGGSLTLSNGGTLESYLQIGSADTLGDVLKISSGSLSQQALSSLVFAGKGGLFEWSGGVLDNVSPEFNGSQVQVLSNSSSGSTMTLNTVSSNGSGNIVLRGGPIQIGNLSLSSTAQSIYINSNVEIGNTNATIIPAGVSIFINPAASLKFNGDVNIQGSISVRAGGQLTFASNSHVTVSGSLSLIGTASLLASVTTSTSGGEFDFTFSTSSSFVGDFFTITNGSGITFSGAELSTFRHGTIQGVLAGNTAVKINSLATSSTPVFYDLSFPNGTSDAPVEALSVLSFAGKIPVIRSSSAAGVLNSLSRNSNVVDDPSNVFVWEF